MLAKNVVSEPIPEGGAAETLALTRKLKKLAYFDSQTSLPNRRYLERILRKRTTITPPSGGGFTLFLLELHGYRKTCHQQGYHAGDRLLADFAREVKKVFRSPGFLPCRLGQSEFALIANGSYDEKQVTQLSQTIIEHFNRHRLEPGTRLNPDVSIGAAKFPDHGTDEVSIFSNCHQALNKANQKGPGSASLYLNSMKIESFRQRLIEKKLKLILLGGKLSSLKLHYQPKVHMDSGKICGAEALVRWNDADIGYINPMELFTVAEQSNLIQKLSEYLLRKLLLDVGKWLKDNIRVPTIAYNLHPLIVRDQHNTDRLLRILDRSGIPRESVIFELSENSVVDEHSDAMTDYWASLQSRGYLLSLDDFGTGHSSLVHLKKIPTHEIKIDRSFVVDIHKNDDSLAIVKGLQEIARASGRTVVAEGVESQEQAHALLDCGCQLAQGYLFSPAVPAMEMADFLKTFEPFSSVLRNSNDLFIAALPPEH